jgi:hypothetical protein
MRTDSSQSRGRLRCLKIEVQLEKDPLPLVTACSVVSDVRMKHALAWRVLPTGFRSAIRGAGENQKAIERHSIVWKDAFQTRRGESSRLKMLRGHGHGPSGTLR